MNSLNELVFEQKHMSSSQISMMLPNIAYYMECLPTDLGAVLWTPLFGQLEAFANRLILVLPAVSSSTSVANSLLRLMSSATRVSGLLNSRNILDSFAKILVFVIQHWRFEYRHLVEVCHLTYRTFNKVRGNFFVSVSQLSSLALIYRASWSIVLMSFDWLTIGPREVHVNSYSHRRVSISYEAEILSSGFHINSTRPLRITSESNVCWWI